MISAEGRKPAEPGDDAGVSPREEALWLFESLVPGTPVNNLSAAFTVAGRVHPPRLAAALAAVLRRHEALRTVYRGDGPRPAKRVVGPDEFRLDLAQVELAGEPTEADLASVSAAPFALDGGPMLRAVLFRSPDTDVVCVTAHQLVFDEASVPLLLADLADAYENAYENADGDADENADGDARHGDAPDARHGDAPDGGHREAPLPGWSGPAPSPESLAFWREELAGATTDTMELSCTEPEPDRPTLAAAHLDRTLSPHTVAGVRRLADDLGVPEPAVLLAAYYVLLEACGAGPDLLVGFPVDVRPEHAARTIGYHVTHVPLRLRVDRQESVRGLVLRSSERLRAGVAHADVAVDAQGDLMPAARSGRRSLPFRHVFDHRAGTGPAAFTLSGLAARPLPVVSGFSKFDLQLCVTSTDDAIALRAVYRTELFERAQAELLLARFEAVLGSFTDAPDRAVAEVEWWSERDRAIVGAANDTTRPVEPASVLEAVRAQVLRTPDAVAVVEGDRSIGYRRLWCAARATSALLRDAGVRTGDVVAVALPRGPELVAAVLGTWLAGAAYLPVDTAHPEERIRYQLSDSAARVLVATADEAGDLAHAAGDGLAVLTVPPVEAVPSVEGASLVEAVPPVEAAPEAGTADVGPVAVEPKACAYLMYTSGSTGRPKGTLIDHAALANVVAHFAEQFGASAGDTTLWTTTFAFDISGLELFVPLVSGGRLVAAPDRARSDGRVLGELIERYGARFVQATPTTWRLVIDRVADRLRGRSVIVGGEPVPLPLAQRLIAAGCVLHHAYGPTETTIWSTSRVLLDGPEGRLDVGRPIRNTKVHVVDGHGRELPVGVRGELCISGAGVAIGYHGRPDLDAERFGEHPEHGRFYRTGDVARWRADGLIDLFGRSDRQVKLRGNRIELGEIEATLLAHPEVGGAAVIMVGDPSADAVLIGCLEPAAGPIDVAGVWAHARARLSRSMLPGELVTVDSMPVNGSGKVDYPALQRMVEARRTAAARSAPDQPGPVSQGRPDVDDLTAELTGLWRSILQDEGLDADTDFFASGGNSMLAALAMQEFQNISGVSISLAEVFERRTPRELAAAVRDAACRNEAAAAAG
ncbi:amino acid adenylation domain-containing protein [Kitasatospora sp. RB6PN24]|uniref:non-ribosomal peptide synthetase n=1 Tax=Kitasatospora humi TaxID=2893891 RepID=UPI001E62F37D|nr:non-ribosomal peptide synthetase [Kitasatospora humi]MCC9312003.1 amino acid adenylation domain-containing protein [Kitasatospora humi]